MKKLGIDRRLMTAGKYKGMLDPFSPRDPVTEGHHQEILDQIHEQFIDAVKDGRGDRLVDNEDVFSGLFWTGEQAKKLGLVDEFGSASYVAREVIGEEKIVDYTPKASILERVAERIGMAIAKTLGTETIIQRLTIR
jgi:protease-4